MSQQTTNFGKSCEETCSNEKYFPPLPPKTSSLEQLESPNGQRSYHLNVVIKIAFMAAMGGFLFG